MGDLKVVATENVTAGVSAAPKGHYSVEHWAASTARDSADETAEKMAAQKADLSVYVKAVLKAYSRAALTAALRDEQSAGPSAAVLADAWVASTAH